MLLLSVNAAGDIFTPRMELLIAMNVKLYGNLFK